MARGVNKWIGIGNLGRDPETRYLASGKAVTNFSIAISDSWTDQQGQKQERTEWVNIVTFDKLAEICAVYLTKGSKVYVCGKIQTRSWEDKSGAKRYTTEIVANEMQMVGGERKPDNGNTSENSGWGQDQPSQSPHSETVASSQWDDSFDSDTPF